jgi:hypothetical protein
LPETIFSKKILPILKYKSDTIVNIVVTEIYIGNNKLWIILDLSIFIASIKL